MNIVIRYTILLVQSTKIFVERIHAIWTQGAVHRSLARKFYHFSITVRCTFRAFENFGNYKYYAALPLSDFSKRINIQIKIKDVQKPLPVTGIELVQSR